MNLTPIINLKPEQQRQIALAGAVMIVFFTLAYIASDVYKGFQLSQYKPVVSTPPISESKSINGSGGAELLFGQTQSSTSQAPPPSTKLQLTLRGAFTASDPSNATAIIETDKLTRSYRVNTLITGNTKLHAVYSDRVVLSNNGQLETLYFPVVDPAAGLAQSIIQQQDTTTSSQAPALSEQQRKAMIKKRLQELRAKVKAQGL